MKSAFVYLTRDDDGIGIHYTRSEDTLSKANSIISTIVSDPEQFKKTYFELSGHQLCNDKGNLIHCVDLSQKEAMNTFNRVLNRRGYKEVSSNRRRIKPQKPTDKNQIRYEYSLMVDLYSELLSNLPDDFKTIIMYIVGGYIIYKIYQKEITDE
jgi:hypothetical protein